MRAITGTTNRVTVTNGDGVAGSPTIDVGTNVYTIAGTDVSVADGGTGRSTNVVGNGLIVSGATPTAAMVTLTPGIAGDLLVQGSPLPQWRAGTSADVGLGNVTNTSDANKPVSTAQQAALDAKVTNAGGVTAIQALTQAAYNALSPPSSTTLYFITG